MGCEVALCRAPLLSMNRMYLQEQENSRDNTLHALWETFTEGGCPVL